LTWLHCQCVRTKFPPSSHGYLYKRHYHLLDCHVPFFYRRHDLFQLISEVDEGTWCLDKYIEKYLSNHKDNQIQNIQTRTYFRDILKAAASQNGVGDDNIRIFINGFDNQDLVVPPAMTKTKEFSYLLWTVRDYAENQWYHVEDGGSCTFYTGTQRQVPTLPVLHNFATHNPDEVEDSIESQYQGIRSRSTTSATLISLSKTQSVDYLPTKSCRPRLWQRDGKRARGRA